MSGLALELAVLGLALALLAAALVSERRQRRQRQADEAQRSNERRLAQAQKMEAVGRLAGGVAHDVNNYLATIRAHCELVAARDLPRERVVEKMQLVVGTVVKASSLIERLLTFARRQPTRPERVAVGEVVESFERLMRGSLPEGVELEVHLAPGEPVIVADVSQLEQVLANLFVNARDALPGKGRITLATERQTAPGGAPEVALVVSDTGSGIPAEIRSQIFDPFFTTKSGQGASGLGLATVQAMVEEAGGRVEVESEVGRGTTFRVVLPEAPAAAAAGAPAPQVHRRQGSAGRGERILLVDDNQDLAAAIRAQLEGLGHSVTVVASAEEALAAAEASPPFALVITDVQLRGVPGTELVDRLRQRHGIRALYMSGYTDRVALRRGAGRAEGYFLKKPFSAEGLGRMVGELLAMPAVGGREG
ncbi:MAG TPA: ATP-binding protein [Thermoanaerobaculia bacterium]|nr:ATP-binding protein [Thermoanaerobaculia bacterium]